VTPKKRAPNPGTLEERKTRARGILRALIREYPEPKCALEHRSAFQLLAATILSAQCTDERVNMVTPELFRRYPGPEAMAEADPAELESLIRSTGFFRNKTKSLLGASLRIVEEYGGKVPGTMEELLSLPGVARKTANVVLGTWFGENEGVVVDTHVQRLTRRMGLTRQSDPKKIEQDLMGLFPRKEWTDLSHRLIQHGRRVCQARAPRCGECVLGAKLCPSYQADPRAWKGRTKPK
jgi:endonuclease-3